jgi:hypothetical protein
MLSIFEESVCTSFFTMLILHIGMIQFVKVMKLWLGM